MTQALHYAPHIALCATIATLAALSHHHGRAGAAGRRTGRQPPTRKDPLAMATARSLLAVALICIVAGLLTGHFLYPPRRKKTTMSTTPTPRPMRLAATDWTAAVLRRCYQGQAPAGVLERALRMLATADGHLAPNGQIKAGSNGSSR